MIVCRDPASAIFFTAAIPAAPEGQYKKEGE
jgi:hypothetical protein